MFKFCLPLVKKFIGNTVEKVQLARDFRAFSKVGVKSFHDFDISQTIFDLIQKTPQSETLYFNLDTTSAGFAKAVLKVV